MHKENRIISADILRISACLLVVLLHVSGVLWSVIDIGTTNWQVINIYNSLSRCCVQIFIMLSGMFFLNPNKNISAEKIYKKYIPRVLIALLFWSCIYFFYTSINSPLNIDLFKSLILTLLKGETNYHLWYLYMLIGLYIVTPILRIITKHSSKREIEYFLVVGIIISMVIPTLVSYFPFNFISTNIDKMYIYIPRGYVVYYLLGYYLTFYDLKKSSKNILYILGLLGGIFTISITSYVTFKNDKPTDSWQGIFTIHLMLYSIFVFLFIKNYFDKKTINKINYKFINIFSSCSFGAFLIHDLFIKYLINHGVLTSTLNYPIILVPLISLLIFICSIFITYLIKLVPFVSRYIT